MARRLILLGWGAALLAAGAFYGTVIRPMQATLMHRASIYRGNYVGEARTRASAQELAATSALSKARVSMALAQARLGIEQQLAARAPHDSLTLAISIVAEEWRTPERSAAIGAAIREAWSALGLSTTKVAVGVVVLGRPTMRDWGRALALGTMDPVALYIPPDSLTPATCVAVVAAPRPERGEDPRQLRIAAASWFGPCAFEARFGIPGPQVRRWLENRRFDVAMNPDWIEGEARPDLLFPWLALTGRSQDWYWTRQYLVPPATSGCAAGRPDACVATLRAGDREPRDPSSGVIARSDARYMLGEGITGGEYFLGAVLRTGGAGKFRDFWRTTLPIDSALTLALGTPAGEWTAAWQSKVTTPPRFGPQPRGMTFVTAFLLAAIAVGVVCWNVRRREVG